MAVSAEAHLAPCTDGDAADRWRLPWLSANLGLLDGAAWSFADCGRRPISAPADDQSTGGYTGMVGSTAKEIRPSSRGTWRTPTRQTGAHCNITPVRSGPPVGETTAGAAVSAAW